MLAGTPEKGLVPTVGALACLEVMLDSPVQKLNASVPIKVTEIGMVTEVRLEQPLNVSYPIEVTELGIDTEVRLEQPQNTRPFIEVMELGMFTEERLLQS